MQNPKTAVRAAVRANSKTRRRIVFLAVSLASVVLIVLVTYRIVTLNMMYPSPKLLEFSLNEEVVGGDVGITVTSFRIYEGEEIYGLIPTYEETMKDASGVPFDISQVRMLVCGLTITNHGSEPHTVSLSRPVLQVGMWKNGVHRPAYLKLNEGVSMSLQLAPGETVSVWLPYNMYDLQFENNYEWTHATEKQADLVLNTYPVKAVVHLR